MAITLSKTSGSGDGSFTVSADAYLGRLERSLGTVNVTSTADVTKKVAITVKQAGRGLFVSKTDISLTGGTVNTTAKAKDQSSVYCILHTNAPAVKITAQDYSSSNKIKSWNSKGHNYDEENTSAKYTDGSISQVIMNSQLSTKIIDAYYADSKNTSNPECGRNATYAVEIYFSIPDNIDNEKITRQWLVEPYASSSGCSIASENSSVLVEIVQNAGEVTLSATPTTITIPAAGTAQTVTVTSNSEWSVATA